MLKLYSLEGVYHNKGDKKNWYVPAVIMAETEEEALEKYKTTILDSERFLYINISEVKDGIYTRQRFRQ